jgi:hypothetical protein
MVDLAEIQAAYYMVAATGVLVAAVYYVFNMRATLQTRQAQMLMSLYQKWNEPQFQEAWMDVMTWQWIDYSDFQSKYSRASNPNENSKLILLGSFFEGLGVFIKRGFIDPRLVDDLMSLYIVGFWQKVEPIFFEMRKRLNSPTTGEYAEYLYKVIYDIWKQQHPETLNPYSP